MNTSAFDLGALGVPKNTLVQDRLLRYVNRKRLHPALIFSGKSDSKLTIAKNAAKALLCLKATPSHPFCSYCSTCDRIEREIHPDVWIWREAEEEILKIESVREICNTMALSPIEGTCRVCIVLDAQRMNSASANAFLKTLEEPSRGRYFWLLVSQSGTLIPTVRSRCIEFAFQPEITTVADRQLEFRSLFQEFIRSRDPYPVTQALKDKLSVIAFVKFHQERLRDLAVKESTWTQLNEFDSWLELERRLRSNASYGLLLEDTLSQLP